MNILFVYRGYGLNQANPVVDLQLASLLNTGINIIKCPITAGGIKGYLNTWFKIRKISKTINFDLIHAHYSLSGFISTISTNKPVVCSLMGSDILRADVFKIALLKVFKRFLWSKVIVKSEEMQNKMPSSYCIPNGIDLSIFKPISETVALKVTEFKKTEKNVIFIAKDPLSEVKNYKLARQSVNMLSELGVKLHILSNVLPEELPNYYGSADLLLLTSLSEGSPNVIKEAMACNCPVVSTDVGDVRNVIKDTEGCFIASFDPEDVADKIKKAIAFGKRTNGRDHIRHLDNKIIAEKIVNVYKDVLRERVK